MTQRLRRSFLFTPADNTDMMVKTGDSNADAVIFDLEDAIPEDAVGDARGNIQTVLDENASQFEQKEVCVRINGVTTDDWLGDIQASVDAGVDTLMVPMVETPGELHTITNVLEQLTTPEECPEAIVNIETPQGLFAMNELAETAKELDPFTGFSYGIGDYTNATGGAGSSDSVREFLSHFTVAAAAVGDLDPIFTVYQDYTNSERLRELAEFARELGYIGQPAIHPTQIDVINDVFTPSEDEVQQARELVTAFDESEKDSISEQGVFLDTAIVDQYRTVIERYEAVSAHE